MSQFEYRPSMFNYFYYRKDDVILYNSYKGVSSILLLDKSSRAMKWFCEPDTICQEDPLFLELRDNNYFVEKRCNEKLQRNYRMIERMQDSSLDLVIHTTKNCNFRCKYCSLNFESSNMSSEIQNDIVSFIRYNINKYSSVNLSWFGGEPLMAIDVIENISEQVKEICTRAKKPFTANVTTNGYLMSLDNVKKLLEHNVFHYAVTIDGIGEYHDKHRCLSSGAPTFDRIIANLIDIKNNIKSRGLSITIRSNVTANMLDKVEEYYRFYDKNFGDDIRFSLFIRPVCDWGGDRIGNFHETLINEKNTSVTMAHFYNEIAKIPGNIVFKNNFYDLEFGGIACTAQCKNKFTIGINGEISKCDDSNEGVNIGQLKNGQMILDEVKSISWLMSSLQDVDNVCDNCNLSCICFMMTECPYSKYLGKRKKCSINRKEIDALLDLYIRTYDIKSIQ